MEVFLRERGLALDLVTVPPNGIGIESASLALSYVADPASAGGVLHAGSSLRTVLWPPLVVITARIPTKPELERFRKQGAVHVTQGLDGATVGLFRKLLEPAVTDRRQIKPGSVASILTSMEKARVAGLLVAACPHWMGLSVYPWENSSLFYCSSNDAEKCRGWAGRIYVVGGNIHHVETPSAKGHHALAQMLHLSEGAIYRFPFFVSPENMDQLGTVRACLDKAALDSENTVPRAEAFTRASVSTSSRPQPPPPPTESKMSSDLDPLLATGSLSGAVRMSPDGRLLATSGTIDADGVAAIASMGMSVAEQVAEVLPFGTLIGLCTGGRGTAFYTRRSREGMIVTQGMTAQTPTLRIVRDLGRF